MHLTPLLWCPVHLLMTIIKQLQCQEMALEAPDFRSATLHVLIYDEGLKHA